MITPDSSNSLKGWKYPIYTDLLDMPVVDALIKAGVTRELLKQNDPNKMQLFDFLTILRSALPDHPEREDYVSIEIILSIEKGDKLTSIEGETAGGIAMELSEVVSIPFKYPRTPSP